MKTIPQLIVIAACGLLLGLGALPAFAQTPTATATVDRSSLSTDETLILTITVDTGQDQQVQPRLPSLDGFRILSSSSGRQLTQVNGATSAQSTFQFVLQPLRAGVLTIPSFAVAWNGQELATDPIEVTVTQGTGQAAPPPATGSSPFSPGNLPPLFDPSIDPQDLFNQLDQWLQQQMPGLTQMPASAVAPSNPIEAPAELRGQDYYAEAKVDKLAPYQGEQVVYTLRLYRAVDPFGQIRYEAPGFTGFWSKEQEEQKQFSTEAGGRSYLVTELKTVLFPTVSGQVKIDPATFTTPDDFFGPGAVVTSQPITLDVKPLPADAPAGFSGAVGQFSVQTQVDTTQAQVGDAVTQRVIVGGAGNLETMDDPAWPDAVGWRAFDSKSATDTQFQGGLFGGQRTIERVLVPTQPGRLILPAVELSYFDPAQGVYRTVRGEATQVVVAPDPTAVAPSRASAPASEPATLVSNAAALRPLKPAPATWGHATPALPQRPGYWLLWGVPLALLAGQALWQRRLHYRQANASALRSQKAAKQAIQALRQARQRPQDTNAAAGRILIEFIGVKLDRPMAGLTRQAIADALAARGVDATLTDRVQSILVQSEAEQYAPAALATNGELLAQTEQIIGLLDTALA